MATSSSHHPQAWLTTGVSRVNPLTILAALLLTIFIFTDITAGMPTRAPFTRRPSQGRRESAVNAGARTQVAPTNSAVVRYLVTRTLDYSYCSGGFALKLRGKILNRKNIRLTSLTAAFLVPLLDGESLDDKMYIWCRIGNMGSNAAKRHNRKSTEFDIETVNNFQGDMRLSADMVDLVLEPFEEVFLATNTRAVPRFSPVRGAGPTTAAPETYLTYRPPFKADPNKPLRKSLPRSPEPVTGNPNQSALRGRRAHRRFKRKMLPFDFFLWDNAEIPFRIDHNFTDSALEGIATALDEWERNTCLRFFHEFDENLSGPHLQFIKSDGCWSYIGKQSNGQPISIDDGCEWPAIVAHEIGHALGFYHEQSRPDRDNYVIIHYENMVEGVDSNFEKNPWEIVKTDNIGYDYSSIMHYGPKDFTSNNKTTVEPRDPSMMASIGQREILTFNDVKLANINYCSRVCGTFDLEWIECKNGGYRNPNRCHSCICPRGFAPPFCDGIQRITETRGSRIASAPEPPEPECSGEELIATDTYQNFSSPGYPSPGLPSFANCTWLIKAPADKRIVLDFVGDFEFDFAFENVTCDLSYVEVRRNTTRPGQRFCDTELPTDVVRSQGNEMLVILSGDVEGEEKGFQARFKTEQCGGCSTTALDEEMVCFRTVETDCSTVFFERQCTSSSCTQQRRNTCFEELAYCCDGFTQSGQSCTRSSTGPSIAGLTIAPIATTTTTTPEPTTTTTTTTPAPTTTTTTTTTTTPPPTTTTTTTPVPTTTTTTTTTTTPEPTTTTPVPTTTTTTTTTTPEPTTTTTPVPTTTTTTTTTPEPTTTTTTTVAPTTTTTAPTTTTTTTPEPTTTTPPPTTPPTTTTTTTPLPAPSLTFTTANKQAVVAQTTTTQAPNVESQRWGRWTSCTSRCGMCGKQFRFRQCSTPPCVSEERACPPKPCAPNSQPLTGCFMTFTGTFWCLPKTSNCFQLLGRRAAVQDGLRSDMKILGTVDVNTGITTLNDGVTLPDTTVTTTTETPGFRRETSRPRGVRKFSRLRPNATANRGS